MKPQLTIVNSIIKAFDKLNNEYSLFSNDNLHITQNVYCAKKSSFKTEERLDWEEVYKLKDT